jgi:hypothetical protein
MGKEDQKSPLTMTKPPSLLLHPLPYLLSHPNIQNLLMGASPLQQAMVGREWVYVTFQLSDLREIKKDRGSYTDTPDQYIQAFISVIQTFELA